MNFLPNSVMRHRLRFASCDTDAAAPRAALRSPAEVCGADDTRVARAEEGLVQRGPIHSAEVALGATRRMRRMLEFGIKLIGWFSFKQGVSVELIGLDKTLRGLTLKWLLPSRHPVSHHRHTHLLLQQVWCESI